MTNPMHTLLRSFRAKNTMCLIVVNDYAWLRTMHTKSSEDQGTEIIEILLPQITVPSRLSPISKMLPSAKIVYCHVPCHKSSTYPIIPGVPSQHPSDPIAVPATWPHNSRILNTLSKYLAGQNLNPLYSRCSIRACHMCRSSCHGP